MGDFVEMMPESMGYDRAITVFSPDGRLFQVEYAREAVKRGATTLGIVYKDGVLFAVKKRAQKIINPGEKIVEIDDHIMVTTAGLVADARVLIDSARVKAQQNRLIYDYPISVYKLTKYIADKQQLYTQYGGVRPYGVSFLVGGYVDKAGLYETDPSGIIIECKARSIGSGSEKINELFNKEYKEGMSLEEAIELAIKGLKIVSKVSKKDILFKYVDKEGIREYSKD